MGNRDKVARYIVYRNNADDDLTALLCMALADYQERHGHPPAGVVAPKTLVRRARQALKDLALNTLPVAGSGGCLVGEVWLAVDGENNRPEA
jgi:hypothetical protein